MTEAQSLGVFILWFGGLIGSILLGTMTSLTMWMGGYFFISLIILGLYLILL